MNERFALAPLGILGILILIGVLFAIVALLRNPTGRKIFLTILTVVLVVGAVLFVGLFTLRVSQVPGPGIGSMPGPRPLWSLPMMMIKPVLLLCVIFGIVGAIRGFKNQKFGAGTILIVVAFMVPALLLMMFFMRGHVERIHPTAYTVTKTVVPPSPDRTAAEIPLPPAYTTTPSIWLDSVAGQFTANVYPSKAAALKGMRPKIDELLRKAAEGKPTPPKAVLFAGGLSATEVHSLMDSPETEVATWIVEPLPRNLQNDEISIASNFVLTGSRTGFGGILLKADSGILEVSIINPTGIQPMVFKAKVDEKPWLEDLAGLQSSNPNGRFAVARSHSSATDEKTAEQEAITDACSHVTQVLWEMNPNRGKPFSGNLSVTPTDLENRGIILDRFSQQLYGMAGPICRHAMLIDLSQGKIQPLANAKFAIIEETQRTWAKMILSFVGMAAIIALVYVFLNAATRGYYAWSLRLAAIVLLGVGIAIVISLA